MLIHTHTHTYMHAYIYSCIQIHSQHPTLPLSVAFDFVKKSQRAINDEIASLERYAYIHTYIHTYAYTYIYSYIYVCIYINIHSYMYVF